MRWAAFDVANNKAFLPDVKRLWARTYWPYAGGDPDDMFGRRQVVRFIGERVYYIREATPENTDYTLGKAGCLPKPCKTLTEAKAVVEMMNAMDGVTS